VNHLDGRQKPLIGRPLLRVDTHNLLIALLVIVVAAEVDVGGASRHQVLHQLLSDSAPITIEDHTVKGTLSDLFQYGRESPAQTRFPSGNLHGAAMLLGKIQPVSESVRKPWAIGSPDSWGDTERTGSIASRSDVYIEVEATINFHKYFLPSQS
jgi:hypothetical protein